jgi:DeoR family glycerol-3-phosphate regulon repressor
MRPSKRHADILRILQEEGTCSVAELARRLDVSLESIRRDVAPLAQSGEVVKMHGAVSLPHHRGEAPFERRMRENAAAKRAIAKRVAERIGDGDTLMLDTGTTTSLIARELLKKRNLTVVTNSSDVARTLATMNGNTVYMAGGQLHGDNGAAFGALAVEFVSRFRVRHAIISIGAIDAKLGPMDYHLDEAELARTVLSRGESRIIATDHSKFGRTALVSVCGFKDFDWLIADRHPPGEIAAALDLAGVRLDIARPETELA